jgi:hypothetical protein
LFEKVFRCGSQTAQIRAKKQALMFYSSPSIADPFLLNLNPNPGMTLTKCQRQLFQTQTHMLQTKF